MKKEQPKSMSDLFNRVVDYRGGHLFYEVLLKWVVENRYNEFLLSISGYLQEDRVGQLPQEDAWELYALSRVLDVLTLRFQPDNKADGSDWAGADISLDEYVSFIGLLNMQVSIPDTFIPFTCEIIEAADGAVDFNITECLFPAVRLNKAVIKRAGVNILLTAAKYDINLVNSSSIYWAYRRKNRTYFDLSQGWGGNSQWRTNLRLDIETVDGYIYNQSGTYNLNDPQVELLEELKEQGLTIQEAIDITRFRHLMNAAKADPDLFPYDFTYRESK